MIVDVVHGAAVRLAVVVAVGVFVGVFVGGCVAAAVAVGVARSQKVGERETRPAAARSNLRQPLWGPPPGR